MCPLWSTFLWGGYAVDAMKVPVNYQFLACKHKGSLLSSESQARSEEESLSFANI